VRTVDVVAAERYCVTVTRTRAANFYYGIRLLPEEKRTALCAIYAMARRIDDIGDGSLSDAEKLRLLGDVRAGLDGLSPHSDDPVLATLGRAEGLFDIPFEAFGDLIDGMEMDVLGTTYERFEDVEVYCRRVAGSIGRLSLGVFGATDRDLGLRLADDLGVAMQVTNIVRDLREDHDRGRSYLPREDLERFGCAEDPFSQEIGRPSGAVAALIRFECRRAREWFGGGLRILPLLDGRSASCVRAMTGIYRRILARVERDPEAVLRTRVSLPPWEKAWVAARSLAGVGA
jgi:phytoene synthase